MILGGLQKLTTLDFPGVVSALVFTQGCNFYCPYCHNAQLIPVRPLPGADPAPDTAEVLAFLKKRAGLLDGLVISGGEPCMQPDLLEFCRTAKSLGYKIKLDTNGTYPEVLAALLAENLIDYAALDLKTDPQKYAPSFCSDPHAGEKLTQSLFLLAEKKIPHELRTTCVSPFVTPRCMLEAAKIVRAGCPWFLQKAIIDKKRDAFANMHALDDREREELATTLRETAPLVAVRAL